MVEAVVNFFKDYGAIGMFIHSFIDAIIFPIPAFFSQVSLSMLDSSMAIWLATIGFIACLLGTPFGYWLGKVVGDSILHKLVKKEWIDSAANLFNRNGEAAILVGAFTPIPFKVFTIFAGVFAFSLWKLLLYAALGRAVKFYAVGFVFHIYGRASEQFVTTYFTYLMGAIAILLGAIIYIKRRIQKKKQNEVNKGKKSLPS